MVRPSETRPNDARLPIIAEWTVQGHTGVHQFGGGSTGKVIECSEGKRVTVRFANGSVLMRRDAKLFERT